jgi:hypothetical protein
VQSSSPGEDQLVWDCVEKNKWCCNTGDVVPLEWRDGRTNTTCCSIPDLAFIVEAVIYTTAGFADPAFSIGTLSASSSVSITAISSPTASVAPVNASPSSLAIGLGVGIGIFAAITVSIGGILFWRRRNRQIRAGNQALIAGESLTKHHFEEKNLPVEIGSPSSRVEMEANGAPTHAELVATAEPAELPAHTRDGK